MENFEFDLAALVALAIALVCVIGFVFRKADKKEVECVMVELSAIKERLGRVEERAEGSEKRLETRFAGLESWLQRIEGKIDKLADGIHRDGG